MPSLTRLPLWNAALAGRIAAVALFPVLLGSGLAGCGTSETTSKNSASGREQVVFAEPDPPSSRARRTGGQASTSTSATRSGATRSGGTAAAPAAPAAQPAAATPMDFGEDWEVALAEREKARRAAGGAEPAWSLVLATFAHEGHEVYAEDYVQKLKILTPQYAPGLRIVPRKSGSMVVYGRYLSRDDPEAQAARTELRNVTANGRIIFPKVMLAEVRPRLTAAQLHPWDLRGVKSRFPEFDTLYTLSIAIWSDFDEDLMTQDERRLSAEAQVAALRRQNYDAYFFHNEQEGISDVTVGIFLEGRDAQSTLYPPEVEAMLRQFPDRYVNGEPLLMEMVQDEISNMDDVERAKKTTRAQEPLLVEVPDY